MRFALGFILGILLVIGCGNAGYFPYKYYNISLPPECYDKGQLLGKSGSHGWADLPLSNCRPDPNGNKMKCSLVFTPDFYSAKGEYLKCQQDLSNCQKKCK